MIVLYCILLHSQMQVKADVCMTEDLIRDALDKLRGAVTIVYPMQLPPYDPIRLEFEGKEDLSGTQVALTNDIMSLKQRHYLQVLRSAYPSLARCATVARGMCTEDVVQFNFRPDSRCLMRRLLNYGGLAKRW